MASSIWTPNGEKKEHWKIRSFKNRHGTPSWMLDFRYPDGERVRKTFSTREKAEEELQNALNAMYGCEEPTFVRSTRLTQEQVDLASQAFGVLQAESGYRPLDILDAARDFIEKRKALASVKQFRFRDLIEQFLDEKAKSGRAERTVASLRQRLTQFSETLPETVMAGAVTSDHVCCWYQRHRDSLSQRNDRAALSNLFAWAILKGHLANSPVDRTERIKVTVPEPAVLPIEACRKLLDFARNRHNGVLLPYVVLGLFAGIRPAEVLRLDWAQIDLESKLIIIRSDAAKLRQRRTVELHETAVKWLEICHRTPIKAPRRLLDAAKKASGYAARADETSGLPEWPADAMRHTAISYHLAMYSNEGKTASWAGNSPDVIHRHYKGLVKPSEVPQFWSLCP